MRTTLYLIRHAATPANLLKPAKLQGRRTDPDLAPTGVRQAAATRDFLAIRPIDVIYSSPLRRAMRTAEVIAGPHGLHPLMVPDLTECDVGEWEGRSWEDIRTTDPEGYARYHADPSVHGYRGENFRQVYDRATQAIDEIPSATRGDGGGRLAPHRQPDVPGRGARLGPAKARAVSLDNCGCRSSTTTAARRPWPR